jgi:hypothetical protein
VNDEADVGAVDAHAEGYGRDHDVDRLPDEALLGALPVARVEAGVIGGGGDPLGLEPRGEAVDVLAGLGVDDARFARIAPDGLQDVGA